MIIAIDYDNTYTVDPALWNQVIKLFQEAGHTVICCTGRTDAMAQPVLDSIGKLVPVVFAGGTPKREACNKQGYNVSVWCDDMPELIIQPYVVVQV